MSISASELAMAMGVDDPQRVFKSDEFVIRERDEAKFMELVSHLASFSLSRIPN